MDLFEIQDQIRAALDSMLKAGITECNLELAGNLLAWGQVIGVEITIKENMQKEMCSLREKIEELSEALRRS